MMEVKPMRISIIFLFSIFFLSLNIPGLSPLADGENNEELSAVIAKEEVDDELVVIVRIISSHNEGDISVMVTNEEDDIVLLETVSLSDGFAEVRFTVDPEDENGDYTAYVSGVDDDGEAMNPASTTFTIETSSIPFTLFGYDGWLVILALTGFLMVIGMFVKRSRKRRHQMGLIQENVRPVVHPKRISCTENRDPPQFERPLAESNNKPIFTPPPIKQEIHHHYAPQYDQSQKIENIVDSVYYRKKP